MGDPLVRATTPAQSPALRPADGSLLLASRVDPAFLLLPLLALDGPHYCPLSQTLRHAAAGDAGVLLRVAGVHEACAQICDVREADAGDDGGPPERLYRLSRDKARAYLARKTRRLARELQSQAETAATRTAARFGSFSVRSEAASSSSCPSEAAAAQEHAPQAPLLPLHLQAALGILSEYLVDEWTAAVAEEIGWVWRLV
jgi:hypothetical protein